MLVNCVAYREGQKLADIPLQDVQQYMAQPNCFVWVAIRDPEPGELEQLQGEFNLHDLAVEDARKGHQRPKFEEYGRSLFVVVQSVELGDDGLHTGQISIFVGARVRPLGAARHPVRLRRAARPDRTRARAAQPRSGVRPLRAARHRGRSLLSGARRAQRRDRSARRSHLQRPDDARPDRGAVRIEAQAHAAEARGRPAARSRRQALWRPGAVDVRRPPGLLPRRARSSRARSTSRSTTCATCSARWFR